MKKIIFVSIAFIAIGSLAYSITEVGAKSFEKEHSFKIDRMEEVEIYNESWDIEFKNTESNKIIIAVEGKQKDEKNDPVT